MAISAEFAGSTLHKLTAPVSKASHQIAEPVASTISDPIPEKVLLEALIDFDKPDTIRKLIFGVTEGGEVLHCDLIELFHSLIAGTSRWGKRSFLRQLLYQIIVSQEPTTVLLTDPGNNTFNNFGLPIDSETDDIVADLSRVSQEMKRRKKLFATPDRTYHTLEEYNVNHPSNPLPHLFLDWGRNDRFVG
ncbi:MAG: FtsK/SpoIIIE domain-containing protein [Chloroflexota bacterium]